MFGFHCNWLGESVLAGKCNLAIDKKLCFELSYFELSFLYCENCLVNFLEKIFWYFQLSSNKELLDAVLFLFITQNMAFLTAFKQDITIITFS